MNYEHFKAKVLLLSETFGATHYKTERHRVLWNVVKFCSDDFMTRAVDYFIGHYRQAPLVPEFQEAITRERERGWGEEKRENAKVFEDEPWPEQVELSAQIKILRDKFGGELDQDASVASTKLLNYNAASFKCVRCFDTGVFRERGGQTVCSCPNREYVVSGQYQSDTDRKREKQNEG
jgi:hypothetical protein